MVNRLLTYFLAIIALASFNIPNHLATNHLEFASTNDSIQEVVVQVSGLVVTGDSLTPLPYATVYRARDSRGTMTDANGFFSLPALEGDTLQFSSTGFIQRFAVIEEGGENNRISIVQPMSRDTVMISDAVIYPWPSRERFKQEFLALGLQDGNMTISDQAIDPFDVYDRLIDVGLDGQAASTEVMRQMSMEMHYGGYPTTNILNPVAWARFIQALKNGDLKRQ
ncbi:MAG: hypothetical protein CMB32_06200 [Euryarchaeota archaeon]|nr:hypothetical protein [Euryarchaeota archaeon]|tara:strand:- start:1637 stop:2308 length:672 start_codon:yes stop_codon:yes gene_type:complete